MDRRIAEALFVQLENCVIPKYREECSMIIDTFIEEEFSEGEFKRLIREFDTYKISSSFLI